MRGIERGDELLLPGGADLIATRGQGGQQLAHDLEPTADTADNQPIHQRSARDEIAIYLLLVVKGADLRRVGHQYHVDNPWQANMTRHAFSSPIWATERSSSARSPEWDRGMVRAAATPRACRCSRSSRFRAAYILRAC